MGNKNVLVQFKKIHNKNCSKSHNGKIHNPIFDFQNFVLHMKNIFRINGFSRKGDNLIE